MTTSPSTPSVSVGNVYLLFPSMPSYYTYDQIYFPNQTYPTGTKLIVPPVGSAISGNGTSPNVLSIVTALDSTTYEPTLTPFYMPTNQDGFGMSSIINYGNILFRAYYDTRTSPYTLYIDSKLIFLGGEPSTYTLTRYPSTSNATVVSLYYNENGVFSGNSVPMVQITSSTNEWYCQTCNIDFIPQQDEELLITVYNETGAEVATCSVFCTPANVINTALNYKPKIQNLTVKGTQPLSTGGFYLYEQQTFSDLALYGELTFTDGTTQQITVDNVQTFLFGQNDFVASYSGLKQPMLMKYNLSPNQTVSANPASGTEVTSSSISVPFTVTVVANQLAAPIKLSVIPQWNLGTSSYELQYYYYSTDHNRATNVTNFVTIPNGTFTGNNFTTWQSFSFTIDMNNVDPVNYPSFAPYTQNVALKFQPPAALVRYLIADSLSSTIIYGADSSACRRPVLYCDTSTNQYFLSSLLFQNSAAILQAFYYNASPPYNTNTETAPPVPTHFTVRNPNTGGLILTSPIPLTNYTSAFSLVNGSDGYYVGGTVIVEFLQISGDSSTYILYGVPVDVHEATYIGPSST
ncbi:MAG: hypothetical protein J6S85_23800 [Methanobrevibacter sp.]|nr:hypothetical protein [Methanobrevibacter sp.]